jgi:hypothetical protein
MLCLLIGSPTVCVGLAERFSSRVNTTIPKLPSAAGIPDNEIVSLSVVLLIKILLVDSLSKFVTPG